MATQYLKLRGRVYYTQHINEPDEYQGDKRFVINFGPDADAMRIIQQNKIQSKLYEANKHIPEPHFKFKSPVRKLINDEVVFFTPPHVTLLNDTVRVYKNKEGKPAYSYHKGEDLTLEGRERVNIQNGSDVEITLVAYSTSKGTGTRLQSINITRMADRPDQMSENKQIEKSSEPVVETKPKTSDKKVPW